MEDPKTGKVDKAFHVDISKDLRAQTKATAEVLGESIFEEVSLFDVCFSRAFLQHFFFVQFLWVDGAGPVAKDLTELLLNRTWRPQLAVTGVAGFPTLESAGNVLRPWSTFMLSLRLPPTFDPAVAATKIKSLLEKDPPYGAKVTCTVLKESPGWAAPAMHPWLSTAVNDASNTYFKKPACYLGEGGSIPFMGMLGQMFPEAQFVITGVLGPKSNAHGPNGKEDFFSFASFLFFTEFLVESGRKKN